ncbi:hypothetical protein [Solemya velum gill symbiont]|uniref:hypothetical protein n=1 Tax=Solemya velum gill symbiont TaxID=2340 RepID=UPI0009989CC8|nr:hypothetical protein [Solemya velum gill symbiont]OOZ44741.1 hypothetical protein BOW37_05530 [Solemya velum gill symbiont]OOZ46867.1 hypothetical protein BOW38_05750 [Solemya velum gill symbiont]OOZ50570.1 hypothetical protein BOW39_02115 [Solemya velum gill symbiont]OOZ51815.1 hypothetical protein BOW40_05590 [Solemya velum gill symbiont]OOZ54357.1 hypothetical protein BOW41_06295 [Solemya velum gill symbiont]
MTIQLSLRQILLTAAFVVVTAVISANWWIGLHYPAKPLYVVILNMTEHILPSVNIEHGNMDLQEKIMAVQIRPGERRVITLNHEPAQGFNIDVNFQDGEKTSACIGKFSQKWHLRVSVLPGSIEVAEVR